MEKTDFQPLSQLEDAEGENDSYDSKSEKNPPRASWDNKLQFILSIIGYAVGLGNIWRFPYLCQQNGGGAFLIPYVLMMVLEGIPLQFLEVAIGQHMRKGAVDVWKEVSPYLAGLGWSSVCVSSLLALYYNVLIMWSFFYLFSSFTSRLPWESCPTVTVGNETVPVEECAKSDATSYFFYRQTLDISGSIMETEGIKWKMCLCLLFTWIVTFACLFKGIKTSGKVMYVTATFPYLVLTIFFGRAMLLPGAVDGLKHLFLPRVERLIDPQVWLDAGTQVFYSLGLGFGGLIAFASYTPPKNNCQRDTILVCIANLLTSLYSGIVIFAVLGFKAHNLHERCLDRNIHDLLELPEFSAYNTSTMTREVLASVKSNESYANITTNLTICDMQQELDKAAQGTGLAFIIFTQVIVEFPAAPFWSILFFLMLLTLGLGSMFGTVECVITSVYDLDPFPKSLNKKWKKPIITGVSCFTGFVFGLIFVTGAGEYWVKLFDSFAGTFPLLFVAVLEVIAVSYIYGMERFSKDIEYMLGHKPSKFWIYMWKFVCPAIMITILIASVATKTIYPLTYYRYDQEKAAVWKDLYPNGLIIVILFLALVSPMCVPAMALYHRFRPSNKDRVKKAQVKTKGNSESTAGILPKKEDDNVSQSSADVMLPASPADEVAFNLGSNGNAISRK